MSSATGFTDSEAERRAARARGRTAPAATADRDPGAGAGDEHRGEHGRGTPPPPAGPSRAAPARTPPTPPGRTTSPRPGRRGTGRGWRGTTQADHVDDEHRAGEHAHPTGAPRHLAPAPGRGRPTPPVDPHGERHQPAGRHDRQRHVQRVRDHPVGRHVDDRQDRHDRPDRPPAPSSGHGGRRYRPERVGVGVPVRCRGWVDRQPHRSGTRSSTSCGRSACSWSWRGTGCSRSSSGSPTGPTPRTRSGSPAACSSPPGCSRSCRCSSSWAASPTPSPGRRPSEQGRFRTTVGFAWSRAGQLARPALLLAVGWWAIGSVAVALFELDGVPRSVKLILSPLWFIIVYLLLILLFPSPTGCTSGSAALVLVWGVGIAVIVDVARFSHDVSWAGWVNMIVIWATCHQLGYFWEPLVAAGRRVAWGAHVGRACSPWPRWWARSSTRAPWWACPARRSRTWRRPPSASWPCCCSRPAWRCSSGRGCSTGSQTSERWATVSEVDQPLLAAAVPLPLHRHGAVGGVRPLRPARHPGPPPGPAVVADPALAFIGPLVLTLPIIFVLGRQYVKKRPPGRSRGRPAA